jgi:hypothetical protein
VPPGFAALRQRVVPPSGGRLLLAGAVGGFVAAAPGPLAAMVHGRRSFRLLLPKRWKWGRGVPQ